MKVENKSETHVHQHIKQHEKQERGSFIELNHKLSNEPEPKGFKGIKWQRLLVYLMGIIILAFGIVLNTKTLLGVSAIATIPYSISQIFDWPFGDVSLVSYILFMLIQLIINKGNGWLMTIFQLPFSIVFTRLMNLVEVLTVVPETMIGRLLLLALAVVLTGIGANLTIRTKLIPNPADGLVGAISRVTGLTLGMTKNFFDAFCVLVTISIGLFFAGKIIGVGLGTIVAVLVIGRVIALMDHLFGEKMKKFF